MLLRLKKAAQTCCKFTVNGGAHKRGQSGKCIKSNGSWRELSLGGKRESRPDFRWLSGTIRASVCLEELFFSSSVAPLDLKKNEKLLICKRSSSVAIGDRGVYSKLQASPSSPDWLFSPLLTDRMLVLSRSGRNQDSKKSRKYCWQRLPDILIIVLMNSHSDRCVLFSWRLFFSGAGLFWWNG